MSVQKRSREDIARLIANDIPDGSYVNLGIGLPTNVAKFLPKDKEIFLHSENGVLAFGPPPQPGEEDEDLVNAGKELVTLLEGGCFMHHGDSFDIMRGGHLDICVIGAFQVAVNGDLANWIIPGKMVKGMGGACDLVSSGSRVVVTMEHTAKGKPKILNNCSLPLTGKRVVNRIITEVAVIDVDPSQGLILKEIAPGVTVEDVKSMTEAPLTVDPDLKTIQYAGIDVF